MTDYRNHFIVIGDARIPLETVEHRNCAAHQMRELGIITAPVFVGDGTFNDDTGLLFTNRGQFARPFDVHAELEREQDEALADERKTFVREAAIRFACVVKEGPIFSSMLSTPAEAWALAKQLWDAKPEDC